MRKNTKDSNSRKGQRLGGSNYQNQVRAVVLGKERQPVSNQGPAGKELGE